MTQRCRVHIRVGGGSVRFLLFLIRAVRLRSYLILISLRDVKGLDVHTFEECGLDRLAQTTGEASGKGLGGGRAWVVLVVVGSCLFSSGGGGGGGEEEGRDFFIIFYYYIRFIFLLLYHFFLLCRSSLFK